MIRTSFNKQLVALPFLIALQADIAVASSLEVDCSDNALLSRSVVVSDDATESNGSRLIDEIRKHPAVPAMLRRVDLRDDAPSLDEPVKPLWVLKGSDGRVHPGDFAAFEEARTAASTSPLSASEIKQPDQIVVRFPFGKDEPNPDMDWHGNGLLGKLRQADQVVVTGHADSIGSGAANDRLSERRAQNIRTWLAAHGVPAEKIVIRYRGEREPLMDNGTSNGRAMNRRVEILIGGEK